MKKRLLFSSMFLCAALLIPGTLSAKQINSAEDAKQLAKAKVAGATVGETDTDYKNNDLVYEVDLYKGNKEYQLTYKASNAKLIKYEWELFDKSSAEDVLLSKKKIKSLAKKKVGGGSVQSIHLEYDDGVSEYKVQIAKGSKTYQLVYHAGLGKLLSYEWEITGNSGKASSGSVTAAKAKKIAKKKVPGATIIKCELDKDDGISVYEIEMVKGQMEYELTINAENGDIIEYDSDQMDD